jgi:hypothetical protein
MLFRSLRKAATLVLKSAPTTVRFAEESKTLAEKYEAQVRWMQEKGITGGIDQTERKPARRAPRAVFKDDDDK